MTLTRSMRALAVLTMILTLAAGCRATTGRSLGTQVDDRTTHAAIKSRLAADRFQNLTWVGVDVTNGIATLTGNVESEIQKQRAENIARGTTGVRGVVNTLIVTPEGVAHAQEVRPLQAEAQPAAQPRVQEPAQPRAEEPAAAPRAQMDPAASPPGQQVLARQTVTGEIRDINRGTGQVRLTTPEGRMDLALPHEAAQTMREGDRVTVEMVIRSAR